MSVFSATVAERTRPGQRQDIEEKCMPLSPLQHAPVFYVHLDHSADGRLQAYTFHAYSRTEGVAGIIISSTDYPALVAHQLLSKVVDEFLTTYPRSAFAFNPPPRNMVFPQLKEFIQKYQDPQQADSILKIQKELDETKIVLHKTIESVLERGEKIDSLVEKSDGLSAQSKMFYKQVRIVKEWVGIEYLLSKGLDRPNHRILVVLSCNIYKPFRGLQNYLYPRALLYRPKTLLRYVDSGNA